MTAFFDSIIRFFEMGYQIIVNTFHNLHTAISVILRSIQFLSNFPNYVPSFLQLCLVLFLVISFVNWFLAKQ